MIESSYQTARQRYAEIGVDTDAALKILASTPISLHCWQGDDVGGFESDAGLTGGGIQATGNYPGKARTPDELRSDLEVAYGLLPGKHRLNLHASYGEFHGKTVDRTEIELSHFTGWIDWGKENGIGIDFNQTFFSHPKANDGFTLSSANESDRQFWIEHGKRCREIGSKIGEALNSVTVTNLWIPDGYKDTPVDRLGPRQRLKDSLDSIFATPLNPQFHRDCVEAKLFGIGSESYVVGSHEFYLGYAIENKTMLCLDAGHFHPTETISDKISSVMLYLDEILLHVSRGVRWDSDHVVTLSDDLRAIAEEIVRGGFLNRVHIGLDYFDASINRVAAWVIGTRNMIKALLIALLEPAEALRKAEKEQDFTARLALLEDTKTLPWGDVWNYYCLTQNTPSGMDWLNSVKKYELDTLSLRK